MNISARISQISDSPTLAMGAKAREMKQAGLNVISMSIGEPDFPTPAHVKQAIKDAVDADLSHYGAIPGIIGLRRAAAKYMSSFVEQRMIIGIFMSMKVGQKILKTQVEHQW